MLQSIRQFPSQFTISWDIVGNSDLSTLHNKIFRHIHLAGMGGSSLAGDLVNDYLGYQLLRPVRDYQLPANITGQDLVICSSYSGNTEETLAILEQCVSKGWPVVCLTHGGQLEARAKEEGLPVIAIPECVQPRCAVGHFFASIVGILEQLRFISGQGKIIRSLSTFLSAQITRQEAQGKALAVLLKDRVPIIYGPAIMEGVLRIWKIKNNENAKVQSFHNVYPELNHNEMVGYTQLLMKPAIINITSKYMDERIAKRIEIMEEILSDRIPFHNILLEGASLLHEIFDAHAMADFTSYHLALEYGVDPTPVAMVEDFKAKLP